MIFPGINEARWHAPNATQVTYRLARRRHSRCRRENLQAIGGGLRASAGAARTNGGNEAIGDPGAGMSSPPPQHSERGRMLTHPPPLDACAACATGQPSYGTRSLTPPLLSVPRAGSGQLSRTRSVGAASVGRRRASLPQRSPRILTSSAEESAQDKESKESKAKIEERTPQENKNRPARSMSTHRAQASYQSKSSGLARLIAPNNSTGAAPCTGAALFPLPPPTSPSPTSVIPSARQGPWFPQRLAKRASSTHKTPAQPRANSDINRALSEREIAILALPARHPVPSGSWHRLQDSRPPLCPPAPHPPSTISGP